MTTGNVRAMLHLLQQLALVRSLRVLSEVLRDSGRAELPAWDTVTLSRRNQSCHQDIELLRPSLNLEEWRQVRVFRAVFLCELLATGPARLGDCRGSAMLPGTSVSQLHESLSHELEKLELKILEKDMTPEELVCYRHHASLVD